MFNTGTILQMIWTLAASTNTVESMAVIDILIAATVRAKLIFISRVALDAHKELLETFIVEGDEPFNWVVIWMMVAFVLDGEVATGLPGIDLLEDVVIRIADFDCQV